MLSTQLSRIVYIILFFCPTLHKLRYVIIVLIIRAIHEKLKSVLHVTSERN